MDFKDKPDPTVAWDDINYNAASDSLRPAPGYRYCKTCKLLYAINNWNFSKNKNNPDGYSYICKNCAKEDQRNRRKNINKNTNDFF